MSRVTTAAIAAALTLGILLTPSAAFAERAVVHDGTGDVWTNDSDPDTEESGWVLSDAKVNVDVVKAVIQHTEKRLEVTATFAVFKKNGEYRPTYWSDFKLADGRRATFVAWIDDDFSHQTYITMEKEPGGTWYKNLQCPEAKAGYHWADDTMTLSIPRSCFDTPEYVKFHGTSVGEYSHPEPGHENDWFWDNANNAERDAVSTRGPWTDRIKTG